MSTTINKVNILVRQGATFHWSLELKNPDKSPIDLTDCEAVMQFRRMHRDNTVLLEVSTFKGGIEIDPLVGVVQITLEDELTSTLTTEEAVYDVLLLWPNGDVSRLREGSVRIALGVTRTWQT
jgi:hypothetical protein